ncbi:MAG: ribonuclease Z [Microthrixaceae bacterium]
MMDVTLLGTGSPIPDPDRAGPATLVRADGQTLLVDAGRGVLMRLAAAGAGANTLTAVLLTHLHSDHLSDLSDVITTRWIMSMEPAPLPIIGPPGTIQVLEAIMESLRSDIGYRMSHHADLNWEPELEITEVSDGTAGEFGSVKISTAPTDHRPVEPSIAFRIESGEGTVVVAGDTVPCATLDDLCRRADVLVHTALRADIISTVPIQRLQDILDYHSSVEQCAQTAEKAGVKTLMLTHYVPAPVPGTEDEWRKLAADHFGGRVEVGSDLLRVEVGT